MKKFFLLFAMCFVIATTGVLAQIKVNSSGYVGINNTAPTVRLDIAGQVKMTNSSYTVFFSGASLYPSSGSMDLGSSGYYWYRFYATTAFLTNQPVIMSDENFKLNVTSLSLMKDKLKLLRPVSYNLKKNDESIKIDPLISDLQYGFIAQELQKVFPEMVSQREDGVLGVR